MPQIDVVFYREPDGSSPVLEWFRALRRQNQRAFDKGTVRLERLRALGHELRRPEADLLRDGIYELRIRVGSVNFRVLYFFHGRHIAVVAHGLSKEGWIPAMDINRALARKRKFEAAPDEHTAFLEE